MVMWLAGADGRSIRGGLWMQVMVRETNEEAWRQAQWIYDHMDRDIIDRHRARTSQIKGVTGVDDMRALIPDGPLPTDARGLEFAPNLWAGISLVRLGPPMRRSASRRSSCPAIRTSKRRTASATW